MLPKEVYDSRKVDRLYIPIASPETPLSSLVMAPLGLRAAALIIDEVVVFATAVILVMMYEADGAKEDTKGLWFIAWITYYLVCEKSWGRTIGKKIVGLRVIDMRTQQRPSFGQVLGRQISKIVDGILFGMVAFYSISHSEYSQRLGDRLASTVVIVSDS
ncbi:MAG TPA: RDD family protein [Thermomicrobiales bacterium]|nr:RDD family protein [Thermomicrobiales bacterium]